MLCFVVFGDVLKIFLSCATERGKHYETLTRNARNEGKNIHDL